MVSHHRATNAGILPYLKPHLIADRDVSNEAYLIQLQQALIETPNLVWVLFSFGPCLKCQGKGFEEETKERTENGKIIERVVQRICPDCKGSAEETLYGFMIAYAPEGMNYVFISQCWTDQRVQDQKLANLYLARTKAWADSLGRERLRCETPRLAEAFTRKWGFQPISTILELDLTVKELSNGQKQWTEEREHIDEKPADVDESTNQRDIAGDNRSEVSRAESERELNRQASDELWGSDSSGSDSTVLAASSNDSGIQSASSERIVQSGEPSVGSSSVGKIYANGESIASK